MPDRGTWIPVTDHPTLAQLFLSRPGGAPTPQPLSPATVPSVTRTEWPIGKPGIVLFNVCLGPLAGSFMHNYWKTTCPDAARFAHNVCTATLGAYMLPIFSCCCFSALALGL